MKQYKVEIELAEAIRIDKAAHLLDCTIEALLLEAANEDRLIYAALAPLEATLLAIPSHHMPRTSKYKTNGHIIVSVLPQYAKSLAIAGHVEIRHWQATFDEGVLDWHFWHLDAPQTIEIGAIYLPSIDVPNFKAERVAPASTEDGLSKREKQIRSIEAAIVRLGYAPMSIPTGGKSALKKECMATDTALFGTGGSPFTDAWKAAATADRVQMKDRKKFTGK